MTATVETAVDSPPHSTPHHHHHHNHNPGGSSRRGSYFSNKLKNSSNRSFSNLSSHSNMVMGCWQKPMSGKSGSSSTDGLDVDHTQNSSPARTVSPRSNERGMNVLKGTRASTKPIGIAVFHKCHLLEMSLMFDETVHQTMLSKSCHQELL